MPLDPSMTRATVLAGCMVFSWSPASPAQTPPLKQATALGIRVLDLGSNEPIPAVDVQLRSGDGSVVKGTTGADGVFRTIVTAGHWTVQYRRLGYVKDPEEYRGEIHPPQTLDLYLLRTTGSAGYFGSVAANIKNRADQAAKSGGSEAAKKTYSSEWERLLALPAKERGAATKHLHDIVEPQYFAVMPDIEKYSKEYPETIGSLEPTADWKNSLNVTPEGTRNLKQDLESLRPHNNGSSVSDVSRPPSDESLRTIMRVLGEGESNAELPFAVPRDAAAAQRAAEIIAKLNSLYAKQPRQTKPLTDKERRDELQRILRDLEAMGVWAKEPR
jgi:hypothetical protein